MAWLRVWLRRVRDDKIAALGLVVLVVVTAFLAALAPRVLERVSDDAIQTEVEATPSNDRDIQLTQVQHFGSRPLDTLGDVTAMANHLAVDFPTTVNAILTGVTDIAETPTWQVVSGTGSVGLMSLRVQPGFEDHIRLVEGRLPRGQITSIPDQRPEAVAGGQLPVFEAVMSSSAAAQMQATVGSTVVLRPSPFDPLAKTYSLGLGVTIVGLYEVDGAADSSWIDSQDVETYSLLAQGSNTVYVQTTVLLSSDSYGYVISNIQQQRVPLRYTWRYTVDPSAIGAATIDGLITGLVRMQSVFPAVAAASDQSGVPALRSALLRVLQAHQARWTSASAVIDAAGIGTIGLAIATLGLAAIVSSKRRRLVVQMSRGRGASRSQVLLAALVESGLLIVPATVIGALAAVALTPSGAPLPAALAGVAVAVVTTLLLIAAIGPAAFGQPREPGREIRFVRGTTTRRLILEGVVVIAAVAGAVILRDRGIVGTSSASDVVGADPLVATVPALVGLAAGLIAIRVVPLVLGALARLAARRRDLVPALAVRRQSREGSIAPVLLILMATATIGAFALATLSQIDRTAEAVSWQQVGAPFRMTDSTGPLAADFDPAAIPGVDAGALALEEPATLSTGGQRQLLAVDLGAYEAVTGDTPADPHVAPAMLNAAIEPLPAIVSSTRGGPGDDIQSGDVFTMSVGGYAWTLRAVDIRPTFAGISESAPFVIVDRQQLEAAHPNALPRQNVAFVRAAPDAAASLRASLAAVAPTVVVESRLEQESVVVDAPIVGAVTAGVAAAAIAALIYAALAVAAAVALAGAERRSEIAHLRILGLSGRQAVGLVAVEYGPMVILAFVVGAALGFGTFDFVRPGLGLGSVIGASTEVPVAVEVVPLVLLFAAMSAIVIVGLTLGAIAQRGAVAATAVRGGIE